MDTLLRKNLKRLEDLAREDSLQVHVVGGTLRDRILDRPLTDIDLTCQNASQLAQKFADSLSKNCIVLDDTPGRQVMRVPLTKTLYFDFAELRGHSIENDLACRDFTLNALAQELSEFLVGSDQLIDPFNGQADLETGILRALPGTPLEDDPLRMLRAFRFSAQLGFSLDSATRKAIQKASSKIGTIAGERISHELLLFLAVPHPDMQGFLESGLLQALIAQVSTAPGKLNDSILSLWNSWNSSGKTFSCSKLFLGEGNEGCPAQNITLFHLALILYPLLETKASPTAPIKQGKGSVLNQFLLSLKLSNEKIRVVERTILSAAFLDYHSRNFNSDAIPPDTVYYRWIVACGEEFLPGIMLSFLTGTIAENSGERHLQAAFEFYQDRFLPASRLPALLDGHHLTNQLKMRPSPLYKKILEQVEEARVLGTISTLEEAEALAQSLIQPSK